MGKFVPLTQLYPATKKLFHESPYSVKAAATVLAVQDTFVILDQTIFYPESGGQDPDLGFINNTPVIDVQHQLGRSLLLKDRVVDVPSVNVDTVVIHNVEGPGNLSPGDQVALSIDWSRRYKLMRNHSASHFVFYAVSEYVTQHGKSKLFTKGCHISTTGVRFDFVEDIPSDWLPSIQNHVNDLINVGGQIVMVPEPESADIFYWTYGDIVIPCGGTHVRSARELGPVRLRRSKKGRTLTRIGFEGVAGEAV